MAVIQLKIRINGEKRVLVFALFCGIFTVDPTFSHHFQIPNNIFEDVTPKFVKFGPSLVTPQSP